MNNYRMPPQSFKCGNSPSGNPCPLGPVRGRCSHTSSETGELAECRPLRTLQWWSRSIQAAMTLAALLFVSLSWGVLGTKQALVPGPLSSSHAQLLVSNREHGQNAHGTDSIDRCAACHPGNDMTVTVSPATQTDLCMNCHEQQMPDALHGSPHDLSGSALNEIVANGDKVSDSETLAKRLIRFARAWPEKSTECSQCHREHQGSKHDLQAMTSTRCQSCHRNQFSSFSTDHPEFKDYPFNRPKNIAFDHARHRDLHFAKKDANFDCKTCHLQSEATGAVGQVFRSVSFDKACAACHAEPIKSAVQDGLIVMQIPSINRKELASQGVELGIWPSQSSQLTDGVIPPIMRLLIQSEPGGAELLTRLPTSGRLSEMELTRKDARETTVELATITKRLMQKLANEGQPGFRASISKLISTNTAANSMPSVDAKGPWLDRFASGLPPDLFRAALQEWFRETSDHNYRADGSPPAKTLVRLSSNLTIPDDDLLTGDGSLLTQETGGGLLDNDLSKLKSDVVPEPLDFKDSRTWDQLSYGGWMIDRQRMAIVYVPRGHADEWLSSWIELEESRTGDASQTSLGYESQRIGIAQQCRQCHALQARIGEDGTNTCWKSRRVAANLRPFSKFDHTPHLVLSSISDCQSCHHLPSASSASTIARENPKSLPDCEFTPLQKSLCTSCHQANGAGESCTQCHNYHIGLKNWIESKR